MIAADDGEMRALRAPIGCTLITEGDFVIPIGVELTSFETMVMPDGTMVVDMSSFARIRVTAPVPRQEGQ